MLSASDNGDDPPRSEQDKTIPNLSSMAKESRSTNLVRNLEEFRGCRLQVTGRRAGFNGLLVCNDTVIRKIELKTVEKSDNWFAINGLYGIESLFFDPTYFLYFVLTNERRILIAQAIPFLQMQIPSYNIDVLNDVGEWITMTRALSNKAGLNIIPRINFKLRVGIRQLVELLEAGKGSDTWLNCVESVWYSEVDNLWRMTFPVSSSR